MLLRTLTVICLSLSITGISHEVIKMDDAILTDIVANECECITNIVDERVYINPKRIFPTDNGLILNVDANQFVALPLLHSDGQGCYVQFTRVPVTSPCPHCGWECISGAFKCRNPQCPSNQPKDKPQEKPRDKPKDK